MAAVIDDVDVPKQGECLACYVARMVEAHSCDLTLRWARLYRDARAPADHNLERRLERSGGTCDCEIPVACWTLAAPWSTGEAIWPPFLPECPGTPDGSTSPCILWEVVDRW